jgi:hypothetical protein
VPPSVLLIHAHQQVDLRTHEPWQHIRTRD